MQEQMFQKIGLTVNRLARDLLPRKKGDRIPSISEYQERFQVARGTVQNALNYLTDSGALRLIRRGHLGTFIEYLDYPRLQECSFQKEILGSMPLPYSLCYQGLATALFQVLNAYTFNLFYARGSESRMKLLSSGVCQFTVCSRYAAEEAIRRHNNVEIAVDLGPGSYLTSHVLIFREAGKTQIESGMRVGRDRMSPDHQHLTKMLAAGVPNVEFRDLKAHQTVKAIRSGEIDAGVWNLDEIMESGYEDLNVVTLPQSPDTDKFSTAVIVVKQGDEVLSQLLRQYVDPKAVRDIQQAVRDGRITADY